MDGFNLQKLIRGNLQFVDSQALDGIQAVDLLASGLRRLLRGAFSDSRGMAQAFGRLFLQNSLGSNAMSLITMSPEETFASPHVATVVKVISACSKRMLLRTAADRE